MVVDSHVRFSSQEGDSQVVGDGGGGGQTFFGFAKRCLVYIWVRCLVHNQFFGFLGGGGC